MRFEESGFETPADNGIGDESVVNFVQLRDDFSDLLEDENKEQENVETDAQLEIAENAAASVVNRVHYDTIEGDATVL